MLNYIVFLKFLVAKCKNYVIKKNIKSTNLGCKLFFIKNLKKLLPPKVYLIYCSFAFKSSLRWSSIHIYDAYLISSSQGRFLHQPLIVAHILFLLLYSIYYNSPYPQSLLSIAFFVVFLQQYQFKAPLLSLLLHSAFFDSTSLQCFIQQY